MQQGALQDTYIPDPPSDELLHRVGLTREEYERSVSLVGRKPNLVELGIIGAMWSEHCSYKTSKLHLRKLPVEGKRVLQGPGENAGVMDLGNDYAVVFKIESHNHPSAVEPFQGAATGVGGIIRDIFAMGARPIALLDSLRFGNLAPVAAIGQPIDEAALEVAPAASEQRDSETPIDWHGAEPPFVCSVAWMTQMRRPVFETERAARAVELIAGLHGDLGEVLAYCVVPDQIIVALHIPGGSEEDGKAFAAVLKAELSEIADAVMPAGVPPWEPGTRLTQHFDQSELDAAIKRIEYTPVQRNLVRQVRDFPFVSAVWRHGRAFPEDSSVSTEQATRSGYCPGVSAEQASRNRQLLGGVVAGISHYGNCIGIPTVGGEIAFDPSYSSNCLVNVMCAGIVRKDRILKGIASGTGNTALIVGAKTGRDGVQGATFASVDLPEDYAKQRPAVQVGDPFMEKLLLEATLEINGRDGLIGLQDFGAAGLTCAGVEMAARADSGMRLDLDAVPQRAKDLSAYEMMLSESQERMMVVVEQGKEDSFIETFSRWGLTAVPCGEVLGARRLVVRHNGEDVAALPNAPLANDAPVYDRPQQVPAYFRLAQQVNDKDIELALQRILESTDSVQNIDYGQLLKLLLASPNIASKAAVFRLYDWSVRTNTVQGPGLSDAAVMRIKETGQGLALTTDCTARHVYLNPRLGAARAVLEAARNVIAVGARPLGITNNLNFGNPQKPDRMWQLVQSIEGMSEALNELGLPVTGGNVSLYNETGGESILPTPVIGMVGLLEDVRNYVRNSSDESGLHIYVLGGSEGRLDGSSLLFDLGRHRSGKLTDHDYRSFRDCERFIEAAAEQGALSACHDISDGGLLVSAFEMCQAGATLDLSKLATRIYSKAGHNTLSALFGEEGQRWLLAVSDLHASWVRTAALHYHVPLYPLGRSGGDVLSVSMDGQELLSAPMAELRSTYENALETALQG